MPAGLIRGAFWINISKRLINKKINNIHLNLWGEILSRMTLTFGAI